MRIAHRITVRFSSKGVGDQLLPVLAPCERAILANLKPHRSAKPPKLHKPDAILIRIRNTSIESRAKKLHALRPLIIEQVTGNAAKILCKRNNFRRTIPRFWRRHLNYNSLLFSRIQHCFSGAHVAQHGSPKIFSQTLAVAK